MERAIESYIQPFGYLLMTSSLLVQSRPGSPGMKQKFGSQAASEVSLCLVGQACPTSRWHWGTGVLIIVKVNCIIWKVTRLIAIALVFRPIHSQPNV
jgi:hypothetical protein